jgi:hypothetical protein
VDDVAAYRRVYVRDVQCREVYVSLENVLLVITIDGSACNLISSDVIPVWTNTEAHESY